MDGSADAILTLLSSKLKMDYTDEQREFAKDFTKSRICFADPGTGKTATAVTGLLMAELFHRVPGKNIYALSFTRIATVELGTRHLRACERLGIKQYVNFQTLHGLCTEILRKNFRYLDMDSYKVQSDEDYEFTVKVLENVAESNNVDIPPWKYRTIINAIRTLNSALVFDKEHVESKSVFKDCGVPFELFTKFRKRLYTFSRNMDTIPVSNILLYTLELLSEHPEISEEFKKRCRLFLVDEAQDLSLLQLKLISLLSDTVVLIGDLKQQIYAFNGACQEIVDQYHKLYPDAETYSLTQSFRCKEAIAKYATPLILANSVGGENFKGVSGGGEVEVTSDVSLSELCDRIRDEFVGNSNVFPRSILFLFRNNYSAIPIAEELFQRRVPFRVNKYTGAHTMPVIKELCELVELAQNPTTMSNAWALRYLIPEFRGYRNYMELPIVKVAEEVGCSLFDVNYAFKNEVVGDRVMATLMEVRDMILSNAPMSQLFNKLWILFNHIYLKDREKFLEYSPDFYIRLVSSLVKAKTYRQFLTDEVKKQQFIQDNEDRRLGVRCYTCHAAKGIEADSVYVLDADSRVIPNMRKIENMIDRGCNMDAAREIRNERALVYVASTRAKNDLHVYYSEAYGLSSLFTGVNEFTTMDEYYKQHKLVYEDVEAFKEFYA